MFISTTQVPGPLARGQRLPAAKRRNRPYPIDGCGRFPPWTPLVHHGRLRGDRRGDGAPTESTIAAANGYGAHFQCTALELSSVCGGRYQTAPHVTQVTVRCPDRPGEHEHGNHATSTFGGISRWPLAQMLGSHSAT